jgi:hypothetical protein
MQTTKRALKPAIVLFAVIAPAWAGAQPDRPVPNATAQAVTGRWPPYWHPPVPPADIPNMGSVRNNAPTRRSAPLPRARPGDLATGAARKTLPEAQAEPRAATVPGQSGVAPAATPTVPTMVPVAPLE